MAKHYAATSLTGGGSGALDKINGALLSDGDTARVTIKDTGRTWFFHLDAQSGAAESPPEVIAPDSGAEAKRWILSRLAVDASTLGTAAVNDMASSEEGKTGQAADKVMSPAASKAAFDSWVAGKTSLPRQAILTGKVADGLPAHLAVSGNDVQINASEAAPLILSFAAGFGAQGGIDYFARLTDNRTIANSALARGVRNYVFAERDTATGMVSCGVTDVPPEYNWQREGLDILTAHTAYAGAYGTISASSEYSTSWPAWKAVDRLTNVSGTAWLTVSGTTAGWLRYVLGRPKHLLGYKLCGRNSVLTANSEPKDWTLRVGAGAVPDVLADTRSGQTGWAANEYRTFMLPAPLACQSFELNIAANAGYTTYTQIDELVPLFSEDYFDLNTYRHARPGREPAPARVPWALRRERKRRSRWAVRLCARDAGGAQREWRGQCGSQCALYGTQSLWLRRASLGQGRSAFQRKMGLAGFPELHDLGFVWRRSLAGRGLHHRADRTHGVVSDKQLFRLVLWCGCRKHKQPIARPHRRGPGVLGVGMDKDLNQPKAFQPIGWDVQ